jgi:hypothetical protein
VNTETPTKPLVASRKDTSVQLGICVRSVDNLIKSGQLVSVVIGRRRMIPVRAIESFLRRKAQ